MYDIGTLFTFHSPYDQFKDRVGQQATITGLITEQTHDVDVDEVGPMYAIRFEDGFETLAWPEEVEDDVRTDENPRYRLDSGRWGTLEG